MTFRIVNPRSLGEPKELKEWGIAVRDITPKKPLFLVGYLFV